MHLVGTHKTLAFETTEIPGTDASERVCINAFIGNKCVTTGESAVNTREFAFWMGCSYWELRQRLEWLQYRPELDGLDLSESHLHLLDTVPERQFFHYWGPTFFDVSAFLIVFRNRLWLTMFLYSENPDYPHDVPMIDGPSLSPFELMETLAGQITYLNELCM